MITHVRYLLLDTFFNIFNVYISTRSEDFIIKTDCCTSSYIQMI